MWFDTDTLCIAAVVPLELGNVGEQDCCLYREDEESRAEPYPFVPAVVSRNESRRVER